MEEVDEEEEEEEDDDDEEDLVKNNNFFWKYTTEGCVVIKFQCTKMFLVLLVFLEKVAVDIISIFFVYCYIKNILKSFNNTQMILSKFKRPECVHFSTMYCI